MKHTLGSGLLAVLATTAVALAAGGGDKDGKEGDKNAETLEKLGGNAQAGTALEAKAGSGFTVTAEDFSLTMTNRVMVRYRFANLDNAADTSNVRLRRLRTKLKGFVFSEDVDYQVQFDWTRGAPILDAWAKWTFWEHRDSGSAVGLRVGAGKTGFSREATGSSSGLEHVERSVIGNRFAGNSRQLGAALHGEHVEGGKLHWRAGVYNGDPGRSNSLEGAGGQNAANPDNEMDFVFTVRVDPMGDMGDEGYKQGDLDHSDEPAASLGTGVVIGNHKQPATNADIDAYAFNVNGAVKAAGFHGLAEVFFRRDDVDGGAEGDTLGWFVSGSYTLAPMEEGGTRYALAGRVGQLFNQDTIPAGGLNASNGLGQAEGDLTEISVTADAYYRKHKLKTQVGWTLQMVDPDAGGDLDNHFLDVLFQWVF